MRIKTLMSFKCEENVYAYCLRYFLFFLDFTAYNKLILDFNIFQKTYVINLPYAYLGDFLKPIALASIFFKEIL